MDNLTDSGGRVTRSLRKRLTSIDVDICNRPVTPISSTLTSISRMSSPSRVVRATRRNSTSAMATPVKTPLKASSSVSAIAEDLEIFTPTKRRSRIHRISINEKEESSQNLTKAFLSDEEIVQSDIKSSIVTRSQSKSPQASRSLNKLNINKTISPIESRSEDNENEFINREYVKKRKPGPRSQPRLEDQIIEEISDDEKSAFLNEVENVINNSLKNVYNDKLSHMEIGENAENQQDSKKCDLNDFGEEEIERDEPLKSSESINSLNASDLNCIKSPIEVKENENDYIITEDERKRTPGRKSKTQIQHNQIDDNISVDEKSNLGNKVEDFKNKSLKNVDVDEFCQSTENPLHIIKDDLELLNKSNIGEKITLNIKELEKNELKNATTPNICCLEVSHIDVRDDLKVENALECDQSILQSDEVGLSISELQDDINLKFSPEAAEIPKTTEIGASSLIDYKEELKKVNFNCTPPNDITLKSSYPRTPVSTKLIKNLQNMRLQSPLQCTSDLQAISLNKSGNDINTTNNDRAAESHEVYVLKCSNEDLLIMDELNTTKDQAERHHEESEESEKLEISTNKILNEDNESENELRWVNPSARGKSSDGSKIDVFITKYNSNNDFKQKDQDEMNSLLSDEEKNVNQQKDQEEMRSFLSDEDKNVDENYSEEDESSMFKHVFLGDEAMEVDNYNSGDSMNSEERRDIEENEIPCNSESIGTETTGDENIEENEDNDDFIVSDNAELDLYESDDVDGGIDENSNEHYNKYNKVKYKRIIRIADSSSSSEDVEQAACSGKDDSEYETESFGEKLAISIDQPLEENNLLSISENHKIFDANKQVDSLILSDCANKSESEEESNEVEKGSSEEILNQSDSFKKLDYLDSEIYVSPIKLSTNTEMNESKNINENAFNEERVISTIQGESDHPTCNTEMKRTVKEMEHTPLSLQCDRKSPSNTTNNQKNITESFVLCEHSFEKDLKSEQPETGLKKLNETMLNHEEPSVPIEHTKYLEDSRHQSESLANPLVHSRSQSLVVQMNLDVEMTNVDNTDKQIDRKSLSVSSSIDYKTSELHEIEHNQIAAKGKRLSKSFSGVSEALNNNNIELSASQVDKTSISIDGTGIEDCENSTQNINYRNIFTKNKPNKNYFHNSQHILKRCDEILEAANLAKLEVKIRNRKRKNKIPKKKKVVSSLSGEVRPDDKLRKILKDVRCKGKSELAISHAVNVEDDVVNNKRKITYHNENEDKTEPIERSVPTKKKKKKEIMQHSEEMKNLHIASSSAGNFVEIPQPTEKKMKKSKYIQLPSGKVIVEPVTPKKRLVKTYDGMEFRETLITPHAVGFKVSKISSSENISRLDTAGIQKRKRGKKPVKDYIKPTMQWTKSGIFKEEIPKRGRNRREENVEESNVNHNFKEMSIMRANIKRSSKHEILLLKQRRPLH